MFSLSCQELDEEFNTTLVCPWTWLEDKREAAVSIQNWDLRAAENAKETYIQCSQIYNMFKETHG